MGKATTLLNELKSIVKKVVSNIEKDISLTSLNIKGEYIIDVVNGISDYWDITHIDTEGLLIADIKTYYYSKPSRDVMHIEELTIEQQCKIIDYIESLKNT